MRNPFAVSSMVRTDLAQGVLPNSKEAYGTLLKVAVPAIIELVLTSLISMIDVQMVSNLGKAAIAAVSLTSQPRMIVLSVFMALNVGVTAIVARRKGEGRQDSAKRVLRSALWIIFLLSLGVTALAEVLAEPLMKLAGANEDTLVLSVEYFRILCAATPINVLLLCIGAAQRGIGNTRVVMVVNLIANLVNVFGNYLLIGGKFGFPALGVRGAAIASVIGIAVGTLGILLSVTWKSAYLRLSFCQSWMPDRETVRAVSIVGGNAMIEQIAIRVGFFISARLVADLGTDSLASYNICMQMLGLTFTFADGVGIAATGLVGENLGKGRADLSMMYGKISQIVALIGAAVLAAATIIFRYPFVSLYTRSSPELVDGCIKMMYWVVIIQPFQMLGACTNGCLRGAGDTKFVSRMMIISIALIRPVVSYLLAYPLGFGVFGCWTAVIADQIFRSMSATARFRGGKWSRIKL